MSTLPTWRPETLPDKTRIRDLIQSFEHAITLIPGAVFGDSDLMPLTHHFADGIYLREMFIPAGTMFTGKIHRYEHPSFLMQGEVLVVTESGGREHLKAPLMLIQPPGTKRAVVALTDAVWMTVHANPTNTQDLEKIEADVICPDYATFEVEEARRDYQRVLAEFGLTDDDVRYIDAQDHFLTSQFANYFGVAVGPSAIEGRGVYTTAKFRAGRDVGPALVAMRRTLLGKYTNHALHPSCQPHVVGDTIWLKALRDLDIGEEVTIDYRAMYRSVCELKGTS